MVRSCVHLCIVDPAEMVSGMKDVQISRVRSREGVAPWTELELLAEVKGRIEKATSADLVKSSNVSQGDLAESE